LKNRTSIYFQTNSAPCNRFLYCEKIILTVFLSFLKREREHFPLFVPRRYWGPGSNVPGRLHERFRPYYVQKSSETVKNVQERWTVRDVGRFKKKITITFQKRKKHCINIMCIIYTACIFTQYEDCSWYMLGLPSLKSKNCFEKYLRVPEKIESRFQKTPEFLQIIWLIYSLFDIFESVCD
jgi:hypothetical protein